MSITRRSVIAASALALHPSTRAQATWPRQSMRFFALSAPGGISAIVVRAGIGAD